MYISDKNYTRLCIVPGVQTAIAGISALKHLVLLINDLRKMLLINRNRACSYNEFIDGQIFTCKKYRATYKYDPYTEEGLRKIRKYNGALQNDDLVASAIQIKKEGLPDFAKSEISRYTNEINQLKNSYVHPLEHLTNLALAIVSATPAAGTIYNIHRLYTHDFSVSQI